MNITINKKLKYVHDKLKVSKNEIQVFVLVVILTIKEFFHIRIITFFQIKKGNRGTL